MKLILQNFSRLQAVKLLKRNIRVGMKYHKPFSCSVVYHAISLYVFLSAVHGAFFFKYKHGN